MAKILIGNVKGPKGDEGPKGPQGIQGIQGPQGPTGEVDANSVIQFSEASQRSNIQSGDSISTIFGKQSRWYTDLKDVAFSGNYNDLNNAPNIPSVKLAGYEKGTSCDAITEDDTVNSAFSKVENQFDDVNNNLGNYLYIGRNRTAIQKDDDLNNYTTPGGYVASYAALVASLSNCPISSGQFTMDVVSDGAYDGRIMQIVHVYTEATHPIYIRYLSNGTTWQSWCKFLGINSANNYTTGTITATSAVTLGTYVLPKSSNGCVMGHAELTTKSTISRWTATQLLTLSIKPAYATMILFYIAADNGYITRGWMGTDGKLYIYSNVEIPSGTSIYPQWNYITKS